MKNVAIIPARGGSKRIPGKNIRPFFGKPLIQYSIDAALSSGLFERVVVTTDSPEIAEISKKCGASVPSLRPPELSNDHAATAPVLVHALKEMVPDLSTYSSFCCILATAPLLQQRYLKEGYQTLMERKVSSVMAMTSFPFPIFRAMKLDANQHLRWVWPEHELTRSNDLPETFHDAGQFYWLNIEKFLKSGRVVMEDTLPVQLPRHLVQDIDTLEDWAVAESIYRTTIRDAH